MLSNGSFLGIATNLDWRLTGPLLCSTARFWKVSAYPALRSIFIFRRSVGWLMNQLRVDGSARNSPLEIRRIKGVKRLGRKIGNWLTGNQAQELLNAVLQNTLRGMRDGAMIGLLLGCGLRRSELVGLRLDQFQLREGH